MAVSKKPKHERKAPEKKETERKEHESGSKTKTFHGGKFTAKVAKPNINDALKEKERLQAQGKKVRMTVVHKGNTKVHQIWVK